MSLFTRNKKVHEYNGVILPFKLTPFMKYRYWGYAFSIIVTAVCFSLFLLKDSTGDWILPVEQ